MRVGDMAVCDVLYQINVITSQLGLPDWYV